MCERWKALTPWLIPSVSQCVWIEHLLCAAQRAADAGSVTVNKSVTPHGVHDKEAAEVSQKGKEAQSVGMCQGHLPETWGKETGASGEWERERFWLREEEVQRSKRDGRAGQGGGRS